MPDILSFDTIPATALLSVGGKGLSLALTSSAGLPVPPGFVVTTDAYRRLRRADGSFERPHAFIQAVEGAYAHIGAGLVAVRSSATSEDSEDTSFAGQQETILGVEGLDALLAAIERCWKSLHTERAIAYRRQQGITDDGAAMAVVVQKLVPAEVAGVLFTQDPHDPSGERMAIEAAWGLGEAVVSGRVTPDRFAVARGSGIAITKNAGKKTVMFTAAGEQPVPEARQETLCLADAELVRLADLGRRVEAFYGGPRDIEWAIADGIVFLLQARPITTATAAERETARKEIAENLASLADKKGTVWVRFNLSEVLPEPTPMTWAIVGRMLAQNGGFGEMNRDLGAEPDESLGSQSAFDLVAGRPMLNLSRMPRMQFRRPPLEYPITAYKADPRQALNPQPVLAPLRDGFFSGLFGLPGTIMRLSRMANTTRAESATFANKFLTDILPPYIADARAALAQDWSKLDKPALLASIETWTQRTLVDYARQSLRCTVFADLAWTTLFGQLKVKLGEARAQTAVAEIAQGAHPPADADFAAGVQALAAGTLTREAFLGKFGHRCRNEMELAHPRWSEDAAAVDRLRASANAPTASPADAAAIWDRIAAEAKLDAAGKKSGAEWAERLRTYMGLREAAKHYLLLGYAVIRKALVELDSRLRLNQGIFFLTPDELPELIAGKDLSARIAARKRRRQLELSLELPPVLFSDDLDAIGRPLPPPDGATTFEGVALSAGVAEAIALVLSEPSDPPTDEPYVLVCPSTDPAWVPLFARAKALVMETGGVLSHGAIVAREFGLPAVAGIADVTRRIASGQRLRVDGGSGKVTIISGQ